MKIISGLALACATLIVVTGCKPNPETQLVGTWKFQDLQANGDPSAGMSQAKAKLAAATVTFDKDKSFALQDGTKPGIAGKWTLADHNINVVVTMMGGKPVAEMKAQIDKLKAQNPTVGAQLEHMFDDLHGTLSADGKTVTLNASAMSKATVTFTKSS